MQHPDEVTIDGVRARLGITSVLDFVERVQLLEGSPAARAAYWRALGQLVEAKQREAQAAMEVEELLQEIEDCGLRKPGGVTQEEAKLAQVFIEEQRIAPAWAKRRLD